MAALMPRPSLTSSVWTKKCSLSTRDQPSHCQATCLNSRVSLMWSSHWMVPPGPTQLPPKLSSMKSMAHWPCSHRPKQATHPTTRQRQPRRSIDTLPHYSFMASATRLTGTPRKRSTMMPSRVWTPSPAPTKVLQLADQYKSSYQQRQPGGIRGGGHCL
jgi:hypothetical protein